MDRFGEWRLIEAADDPAQQTAKPDADPPADDHSGKLRLTLLLAAVVLGATGIAIAVTAPQAQVSLDTSGQAGFFNQGPTGSLPAVAAGPSTAAIVVDVQGAVVRPGLHRLPEGSRLGDAIAAAGGYGAQVDIAAAASLLNLAAKLADGEKIYVPARGEASHAALPTPGSGSTGAGGLIDINHASADELDTLPGIGPVTAGKIIAAREQASFASVDELLSREVVGQSVFDNIVDLVTVGP